MTAAFHLNNREAKRELKVYNNDRLLPFRPIPTYLWGKTGQIAHVSSPSSDITQKIILAHYTAEATGGLASAGAKTLCIVALSLVYSTAEYCAPVWCRSTHTRLIDSVLNDALLIVSECLHPTPRECRSQPAELR